MSFVLLSVPNHILLFSSGLKALKVPNYAKITICSIDIWASRRFKLCWCLTVYTFIQLKSLHNTTNNKHTNVSWHNLKVKSEKQKIKYSPKHEQVLNGTVISTT